MYPGRVLAAIARRDGSPACTDGQVGRDGAREEGKPQWLRGLQYFEAVNRHASLKRAAQDLGVTESAVSHQMRRFSALIGRQLLAKSGRASC